MARQITTLAATAFQNGTAFKRDNTKVTIEVDGAVCLHLHGHLIAKRYSDGKKETEITNAGWATNTTKERLNGLDGVSIYQKKGIWYLNDKEWNGDWIIV